MMNKEGTQMDKLTLKQAAGQVKMKAVRIAERPDKWLVGSEFPWEGTHWRLTLVREWWETLGPARVPHRFRRTWSVYWSQGSACGDTAPEIRDVLESLLMDVQGLTLTEHFETWCGEYGFSTDSRKAERIYKACVKAARAWARFWEGTEIVQGEET